MKLNNNWKIETETNGGMTLIFSEKRIRNKNTEKEQEYIFEDRYYYPTIYQCLRAFIDKSIESSKDIQDCIKRIEQAYSDIERNSYGNSI